MDKQTSFYEWELSFKNPQKKSKEIEKDKDVSMEEKPLGIPKEAFEDFLRDWKKKNLNSI